MRHLYVKNILTTLKLPKQKWLYYLLQFTWGLPANIVGGIIALYFISCKRFCFQHKYNICCGLRGNAGFSLGIFNFVPLDASDSLKNHEFGHSVQNIYFGPFYFGMVGIPSVARFLWREIQQKRNKPLTTQYDDIWFEGQATKNGK
jgi:hypothetical protein